MASVKVLVEGYYFRDRSGQENACATISLVRDEKIVMVVDPGTLKDKKILIDALATEKLTVEDVNMVCITHSHIDHYKNVGMFPKAKVLEYFGVWNKDKIDRYDEQFTAHLQILKTPGHDDTSITLFVTTDKGVVAICGDIFWKENFPEIDLYASDLEELKNSRRLVLRMSKWIVPGHAGIYKVKNGKRLVAKSEKKKESKALGSCRNCHRPFEKTRDKCFCQDWLCYRCCECEFDCLVCNCEHHKL